MNENFRNVNQGYVDITANFINCFVWSKSKIIIILKRSHHAHTDRFTNVAKKIVEFTFLRIFHE